MMINLLIPLLFLLVPTFLFFICGQSLKNNNPEKAKIWYILAVVYFIIGFGVCSSMIKI